MSIVVQIRLTSHFLGALKPGTDGVRRFERRHRDQWLLVPQELWRNQLREALRHLRLPLRCLDGLGLPEAIMPATTQVMRRTYSRVHVEFFEIVSKGAVLSFDLRLRPELPGCPSPEQLYDLLVYTGEHLGWSPFGNKFGFGRFHIENYAQNADPRKPARNDGTAATAARQPDAQRGGPAPDAGAAAAAPDCPPAQ